MCLVKCEKRLAHFNWDVFIRNFFLVFYVMNVQDIGILGCTPVLPEERVRGPHILRYFNFNCVFVNRYSALGVRFCFSQI